MAAPRQEQGGYEDSGVAEAVRRRLSHVCSTLGLDAADVTRTTLPHLQSHTQLAHQKPLGRQPVTRTMAHLIDHTLLKQEAVRADVEKLCCEASQYSFAAVCVNGCWAQFALDTLRALREGGAQPVKVACVVGFPLGATTPPAKAFEARQLVELGVDEIDMVVNVGMLKDHEYRYVLDDIKAVVGAATRADGSRAVVKVILETGALTLDEIIDGCILSAMANAHFVKTSTGFNATAGGAKVQHVKLMKAVVGDRLLIKASGGVRSPADVEAMVAAGASRIGTSSGVALVASESSRQQVASGY